MKQKIEEIDKFSLGDVKIKFTVSEGALTGRWKEGKDAGPMRGNWLGEQIGSQTQQAEKEKEYPMMQRDWGIAESIAVLMRHMLVFKQVNCNFVLNF